MSTPEYILLVQNDSGDYYVGQTAALYRDGRCVWSGYSNDQALPILRVVLGEQLSHWLVENDWKSQYDGWWSPTLAEQLYGTPEK